MLAAMADDTRARTLATDRDVLLPTATAGAASGAVAAAVMGLVFMAADHLGLEGEAPPERIARKVADRGPADPSTAEKADAPLGTALHLGFGAVLGALFAVAAPRIERRIPVGLPEPILTTTGSLAFAGLVYLVSYAGWVPALRLLPPPDRDRPGRQIATILAHAVFGGTLAAVLDRTSWGPRDRL